MSEPRASIEVAGEKPAAELELELEVRLDGLAGSLDGGPEWQTAWPLDEEDFLERLDFLRVEGTRRLPLDDHGRLSSAASAQWKVLLAAAVKVGQRLTAMLSPEALLRLIEVEAVARARGPALFRLKVGVAADGDAGRADRLLALPWELLRLADRFPVEQHTFDLVREAVVPHLPGLSEPDRPLEVVATAAAPIDKFAVDHEGEMYHLWRALGARDEGRLRVADLGTLEELAYLVCQRRPPVVHFTGHGMPGGLLFEDDFALGDRVDVEDLIKRLRIDDGPLPRLIYLSACFGMNLDLADQLRVRSAAEASVSGASDTGASDTGASDTGASDTASAATASAATGREVALKAEREALAAQSSTAAALHRGGFSQVVGYFGPVGDLQATRLAGRFYSRLAQGHKARSALRAVRELATTPLVDQNGRSFYPLGWAQIALYHRGADHATALSSTSTPVFEARPAREFVRLDQAGGAGRVERRHDKPLIGVQQLRDGFGFIGRRGPRAEGLRRWRDGRHVLVVQGMGGLGKTTFCAELLRLLGAPRLLALDGRYAASQADPLEGLWREVEAARPGDESWSYQLGQLQQEGMTGQALAAAIGALALREGGTREGGLELVVYLDDAESLLAEPGSGELSQWRTSELQEFWLRLVEMAEESGSIGLLASSRYRPEGTPEGASLNLGEMSKWEALRLLGWMPVLSRLPHTDRDWLTSRVDGHPRTIEWLEVLAAAAERRLAPPGDHFRGDWRKLILLPILEEAGEKVDADLLLARIWDSLDENSRELLGRLSILTAPVPWAAILHLERAPGGAIHLVDASLLSPHQSPESSSWWAPHSLVAAMVRARWKGDAAAAHRQLGGWYRSQLGKEDVGLFAQRAVEHLCAGGDGDGAFPIVLDLAGSLAFAGRVREASSWFEKVLSSGVTGSQLGRSLNFHVLFRSAAGSLQAEDERRLLQALKLVEAGFRSEILATLGLFYLVRGDLTSAQRYCVLAIEEAEELGYTIFTFSAFSSMVAMVMAEGDVATAKTLIEPLLPELQNQDSNVMVALLLLQKGQLDWQSGDLATAKEVLGRALEVCREVFQTEQHPFFAAILFILGSVLCDQDDLGAARECLELALKINSMAFGTDINLAGTTVRCQLASVLRNQGDLASAKSHLEQALKINSLLYPTEIDPFTASIMEELADLCRRDRDFKTARKYLERAIEIRTAVDTEIHTNVANSLSNLAGVMLEQGDLEAARETLVRYIEIKTAVRQTEVDPSIANSLNRLGLVLQEQGNFEGARVTFEKVIAIDEQLNETRDTYGTAKTELELGLLLQKVGDPAEGNRLLRHAWQVFVREKGSEDPNALRAARGLQGVHERSSWRAISDGIRSLGVRVSRWLGFADS